MTGPPDAAELVAYQLGVERVQPRHRGREQVGHLPQQAPHAGRPQLQIQAGEGGAVTDSAGTIHRVPATATGRDQRSATE